MRLPKHINMQINHNEHNSCYENIKEYLDREHIDIKSNLSEEEYQRCIDTNEIWEIQWYPITPIGFYYVCAPTLNEALDKMNKED